MKHFILLTLHLVALAATLPMACQRGGNAESAVTTWIEWPGPGLTGHVDSIVVNDTAGIYGDPLEIFWKGLTHWAWTADTGFTLHVASLSPTIQGRAPPLIATVIETRSAAVRYNTQCPGLMVLNETNQQVWPTDVVSVTVTGVCDNWFLLPPRVMFGYVRDLSCVRDPFGSGESCLYEYDLSPGAYRIAATYSRDASIGTGWDGWDAFAAGGDVGRRVQRTDTTTLRVAPASDASEFEVLPLIGADAQLGLAASSLARATMEADSGLHLFVAPISTTSYEGRPPTFVVGLVNVGPRTPIQYGSGNWSVSVAGHAVSADTGAVLGAMTDWMILPDRGFIGQTVEGTCFVIPTPADPRACPDPSLHPGKPWVVISYKHVTFAAGQAERVDLRDSLQFAVHVDHNR